MKTQLVLCCLIVGLCASLVTAKTCPANFFGYASSYNVFLLGDSNSNGGANTVDLANGEVQGTVHSTLCTPSDLSPDRF
jgi:hypothetical protein